MHNKRRVFLSLLAAAILICLTGGSLFLLFCSWVGANSLEHLKNDPVVKFASWFALVTGIGVCICLWLALGRPGLRAFCNAYSADDGYKMLERATRLERKGRVQEALDLYEHIAAKYSHTTAAQDAQASIKSLRAQL